ncbi:MAG: zinc ribbon domain-containing protein [Deltaproteobacteria bacterium]|nr:zinc ribbon domain-containing protein [Deltaproteobacteria bacterium]MBW2307985.1 zinc ribbon domain-containing protein [Deltaproteobacteria bacterium]
MPIYEYRCTTCGEKFEKLVINRIETILCSTCGSPAVEKLFSRFGFKSKGRLSGSSSAGGCGSCTAASCSSCR